MNVYPSINPDSDTVIYLLALAPCPGKGPSLGLYLRLAQVVVGQDVSA